MSKFYLIVIALIVACSALPDYVCANVNLIDNPSVELSSCGNPVGWTSTNNVDNISHFTYDDDSVSGSKSIGINVAHHHSGEEYWSFREITVPENPTGYRYSAHYKSSIPTKLVLITKNSTGVESSLKIADYPAQNKWTRISVDLQLPDDAVTMKVAHVLENQGVIQLDDFLLEENHSKAVSHELNLIPNSSLEIEQKSDSLWPENWLQQKNGTNTTEFIYLNSGYSGTKSIKMIMHDHESGHSYNYFKPVAIQGGAIYDYSFFHKSDVYTEVNAEITLATGEVVYRFLGVTFPSSNWTKFSTRVQLPNDAVKVSLYNLLYSVGSITQDGFMLTPVQVIPFNRPIVSVTFDDSLKSLYDVAFPMFKSRNLPATAYVLSGNIGLPNYISVEQFKEMHRNGFELGSHTVTHPHLPFLSSSAAYQELVKSKKDINDLIGVVPQNFASPYGEYNDEIKKQIRTLYRSHRSTDPGYNSKDNFDIYNIKTQNATNKTSPATVLGWVDTAIKDKTWLVLVYHDIAASGTSTFTNTPEHLQKVLDGLVERKVHVVTVDDALSEVVPQMQ